MIGGALAKPVETLPSIFAPGSLWDRFPYLLPNLFSAVCVLIGVVIGILFLEETHAERKLERDRGLELGKVVLSYLPGRTRETGDRSRAKNAEEQQPLLFETEEPLPTYLTNETSPGSSSTSTASQQVSADLEERDEGGPPRPKPQSGGRIFTKPVVTIIASYGILAL